MFRPSLCIEEAVPQLDMNAYLSRGGKTRTPRNPQVSHRFCADCRRSQTARDGACLTSESSRRHQPASSRLRRTGGLLPSTIFKWPWMAHSGAEHTNVSLTVGRSWSDAEILSNVLVRLRSGYRLVDAALRAGPSNMGGSLTRITIYAARGRGLGDMRHP